MGSSGCQGNCIEQPECRTTPMGQGCNNVLAVERAAGEGKADCVRECGHVVGVGSVVCEEGWGAVGVGVGSVECEEGRGSSVGGSGECGV